MSKLTWDLSEYAVLENRQIPCASNLPKRYDDASGIRIDSPGRRALKTILWPLFSLRHELIGTAFIERALGRWIRELWRKDTAFLEVGCGNMALRKYIPRDCYYNAFDISLSEFHLRRALHDNRRINIALASATDIPLATSVSDLIVSVSTLTSIPDIAGALAEIHRVAKPGATFLCVIHNGTSDKYIGRSHVECVHSWSFDEFRELAAHHGFECVKAHMGGWWFPCRKLFGIIPVNWHLPFKSRQPSKNAYLFYMFNVGKNADPTSKDVTRQ